MDHISNFMGKSERVEVEYYKKPKRRLKSLERKFEVVSIDKDILTLPSVKKNIEKFIVEGSVKFIRELLSTEGGLGSFTGVNSDKVSKAFLSKLSLWGVRDLRFVKVVNESAEDLEISAKIKSIETGYVVDFFRQNGGLLTLNFKINIQVRSKNEDTRLLYNGSRLKSGVPMNFDLNGVDFRYKFDMYEISTKRAGVMFGATDLRTLTNGNFKQGDVGSEYASREEIIKTLEDEINKVLEKIGQKGIIEVGKGSTIKVRF